MIRTDLVHACLREARTMLPFRPSALIILDDRLKVIGEQIFHPG